ncbi:hypothetical protein [Pyxidicoccus caerfyrddinensis]|uniref:hypothetical protein n=1 Tax=Pyxidicoccus caerfyrddinensis TaxID=2709663 RepID=UPI0013DCBC7D|nr:hypothetical protein [Pyxidicoccus caerfyrddinensis]
MLPSEEVEALRRELAFLAGDADGEATLDRVLGRVVEATRDANGERTLRFESPNEEGETLTWTLLPPSEHIDRRVPPTLRRILERCGGSWMGEPGTADALVLHDGFSGTLDALGRDLGLDAERDGFEYAPELCAPIDVGLGRVYVFHPVTGELRHFDQDGGLEPEDVGDVGSCFLSLIEAELG